MHKLIALVIGECKKGDKIKELVFASSIEKCNA